MAKTEKSRTTNFGKVITLLLVAVILLAMFAGCNKEKTPEEEFSMAKEEVTDISTRNFYCFKEFIQNVALKEEGIELADLFIRVDNDDTVTVHVLSPDKTYTVYTVESIRIEEIVQAIYFDKNYIYLKSNDDDGNIIYVQREFNNTIWNSLYDVEGDRIILDF